MTDTIHRWALLIPVAMILLLLLLLWVSSFLRLFWYTWRICKLVLLILYCYHSLPHTGDWFYNMGERVIDWWNWYKRNQRRCANDLCQTPVFFSENYFFLLKKSLILFVYRSSYHWALISPCSCWLWCLLVDISMACQKFSRRQNPLSFLSLRKLPILRYSPGTTRGQAAFTGRTKILRIFKD